MLGDKITLSEEQTGWIRQQFEAMKLLETARDCTRSSIWAVMRQWAGLPGGRHYAFDTSTGMVIDAGPDYATSTTFEVPAEVVRAITALDDGFKERAKERSPAKSVDMATVCGRLGLDPKTATVRDLAAAVDKLGVDLDFNLVKSDPDGE